MAGGHLDCQILETVSAALVLSRKGDECPRLAVRLARSVDPPCASDLEVFTMPTLKAIGGTK